MLKRFNAQDGFTLIEVIAVLVILGILSAIIANRWTNFDTEVYTGADALKAHLRYAQAQAMNKDPNADTNTNTIMGIAFDAANNRYWLFKGTSTSDIQLLPDDAKYATADRKIDLALKKIKLTAGITAIYFDDRGIPYTGYTSSAVNVPLDAPAVISVTGLSGSPKIDVKITPRTGYVP